MTAEKLFPLGAWRISDIIDGHLVSHVYVGYTKAQAMRLFAQEYLKKETK